jgi:hypothetical protein
MHNTTLKFSVVQAFYQCYRYLLKKTLVACNVIYRIMNDIKFLMGGMP